MSKKTIIKRIEPKDMRGQRIYQKDFKDMKNAFKVEKYNFNLLNDTQALKKMTKQEALFNKHLQVLKTDNKNQYSRRMVKQSYQRFIKSTEKVSTFDNGKISTEIYRIKKNSEEFQQRKQNLDGYKIDLKKRPELKKIKVHERGNYYLFNDLIQKMGGFTSAFSLYQHRVEELISEYNIDQETFNELY